MFSPSGKKVIYHFGRWHGFNAAFSRLTDEQVTIVILGNKFSRSIYNAAYYAYNIFGDYIPLKTPPEKESEFDDLGKKKAPVKIKSGKPDPKKPISKSRQ
jgi:hypothetical protein